MTATLTETDFAVLTDPLRQRARARLAPDGGHHVSARPAALGERERDLVRRYTEAFEHYDTAAVVFLLAEDVTWEMSPFAGWYAGAAAIETMIRGGDVDQDARVRHVSCFFDPDAVRPVRRTADAAGRSVSGRPGCGRTRLRRRPDGERTGDGQQ